MDLLKQGMRALLLWSVGAVSLAQAGTVTLKPLQQFRSMDFSTQAAQSIDFSVAGSGNVLIRVMTADALAYQLRLPDGTVVDPGNAAAHGVRFESFTPTNPYETLVSATPATLIEISDAAAGAYTLSANAAANGGEVPVLISDVGTSVRGGLAINGGAPWVSTGSPAAVSLALFDAGMAVVDASVTAYAQDADGIRVADFSLHDDGQHGDAEAGDGLYTGVFNPPAAGTYFVYADIAGTDSHGNAFGGFEAVRLVARSDDLQLTGAFTDHGIDQDGDGYFDAVRIELATTGPRHGGEYAVHLQLQGNGGQQVTAAARVQDPAMPLAVDVPAERLKHLVSDGPYRINYAILWHDGEPIGRWDELGSTAAYSLDQLERQNSVLHPLHSDQGVDFDGDGLFDRLDVTFDADVLLPGYYGVSADLRAPDGAILDDSGLPQIYLSRGHNDVTVHFTGTKIGEGGQDGPYRLTNVLLYPLFNASASALADRLGETAAYGCTQFPQCDSGGSIEERFARLLAQVEALPLNQGLRRSLAAKLEGARRALERDNRNAVKVASNKVRAFINEVLAQRDEHIPRNEADLLIDGAAALRDLIES